MVILSPNTKEGVVNVIKNHIFVSVTDYGLKEMLKEIIVSIGQHHWEWISFTSINPIDIKDIGTRFSSFDNALNRAVNDVYSTVYEFDTIEEMVKEWGNIKYVESIKTIYKSE